MAQSKKDLKRAVKQVKAKVKLEKPLFRKISKFFNKQSAQIKQKLNSGEEFDAEDMAGELRGILTSHYKKVAKIFTPDAIEEINKALFDYDPTIPRIKKNDKRLESVLLLFIINSVNESVVKMTATSNRLVSDGQLKADQKVKAGEIEESERNKEAVAPYDNKKQGRSQTVAVTETQKAAEGTKFTIANAANDGVISAAVVAGGSIGFAVVQQIKEWFTMGDSKVRPWHSIANAQEQKAEDPFIVDNELLMYPGDTDFGASPRNICHCRCVAIYRTVFG